MFYKSLIFFWYSSNSSTIWFWILIVGNGISNSFKCPTVEDIALCIQIINTTSCHYVVTWYTIAIQLLGIRDK